MVESSTRMSANERRIRVLLMEPNPILLEGITSLLRDEPDMELVGSAMSALAGVDLLRQVQPNVILLDLDLAGATSAMTVRELRGVDTDASIIVLASYELDPAATSVIQAGAAAVIAKHQLENSLLDVIRTTRAGRTNT
jgi:DNA-binding NarL/FixJ family response regulator